MYVQEIRTYQRGKVYRSVLVRQSYRVGKQVKTKILANLTRLPGEVQELIRRSLRGEKLLPLGDLRIQEARDYGGLAVLEEVWKRWGLDQVLSAMGSERKQRLLKTLVFGRILFPSSRLALEEVASQTALAQVCGLEPKDLEKEELAAAVDGLTGVWSQIERKLCQATPTQETSFFLFRWSSSSRTGEEAGKATGGTFSHDDPLGPPKTLLAIATNAQGIPIHIEVLRAHRGDKTTLHGLLVTLQRRFGIEKTTFVFDRDRNNRWKREGFPSYVTRASRAKLQKLLHELQQKRALWLADRKQAREIFDGGVRYVLAWAEWQQEQDRRRRYNAITSIEEVLRQAARTFRKNGESLASARNRIARELGCLPVKKHFRLGIDRQGRFSWKLDQERVREEKTMDGWYLLETDLPQAQASAEEVLTRYYRLIHLQALFSELANDPYVDTSDPSRPDQVRNQMRIAFLALRLTARLQAEWISLGLKQDVLPFLRCLQAIRLIQLTCKEKPLVHILSPIPSEWTELLEKAGLFGPFAPFFPE